MYFYVMIVHVIEKTQSNAQLFIRKKMVIFTLVYYLSYQAGAFENAKKIKKIIDAKESDFGYVFSVSGPGTSSSHFSLESRDC